MPKAIADVQQEKKEVVKKSWHSKSLRETISDINKRRQEMANKPPEETPEIKDEKEKKDEAIEAAVKERRAKKQEEAQAKREKELEEKAAKAAEEALAKKEAEEAKKAEEEAAKAKKDEEYVPVWKREADKRKKDENGNPLPADYDEIFLESKSAAVAEAKKLLDEREAAQKAEQERARAEAEAKEKEEATKKQQEEEYRTAVNKQIEEEMEDLRSLGRMPKIINKDDPNDPGIAAQKELFAQAMAINEARQKEGKPMIVSPKLIFYEHYKPSQEVPGADAPIAGNGVPSRTSEGQINIQDLRKKSISDLVRERYERLTKKS